MEWKHYGLMFCKFFDLIHFRLIQRVRRTRKLILARVVDAGNVRYRRFQRLHTASVLVPFN